VDRILSVHFEKGEIEKQKYEIIRSSYYGLLKRVLFEGYLSKMNEEGIPLAPDSRAFKANPNYLADHSKNITMKDITHKLSQILPLLEEKEIVYQKVNRAIQAAY
jgi:hypothetical protein